jgi:hypothetical protein
MKYATPLEILVRKGYIYVRGKGQITKHVYVYQHQCSTGVNYFSMIIRRESYFTWEVHLGVVFNSSSAYTINVYLYFWYWSVDTLFEALRPRRTLAFGVQNESQAEPFDEGDCNDGVAPNYVWWEYTKHVAHVTHVL